MRVQRLEPNEPLADERPEHAVQSGLGQLGGLHQAGERRGAVFACDCPHDRDALGEGGSARDGVGNDDRVFAVLVRL